MDKPDAIRLAEHLEEVWYQHKAAAELRRLHAENERLAAEVANRNRRALDGDEAVSALANVHAYYEKLEAQRDALLEALKTYGWHTEDCPRHPTYAQPENWPDCTCGFDDAIRARGNV